MAIRARVHWIIRLGLMLFILASVAFISALVAMRFAVQGRQVTIPDIIGKPADNAQQMLQARHVGMRVEDHLYSNYPVGTVVRQSPPAKDTLKLGEDVYVVLSLGPQKETIPLLEEKSLRAARIELLRSGLQIGEITSAYLPGYASDLVLQQDPAPGQQNLTSAHVDFLVSLGPQPDAYVMPDLTGLPTAEAQLRLAGAGLKPSKLTPVSIPGTPPGTVLNQSPARGQKVDSSTMIELQVAQ